MMAAEIIQLCESCHQRPGTTTVSWDDVEEFWLCGACLPEENLPATPIQLVPVDNIIDLAERRRARAKRINVKPKGA